MKKFFLITEFLIYILFIILDINHLDSAYIKYLGIALCLVFSIYRKNHIKSFAMLFTFTADFFLLVINKYYEIGLISFICAQICYIYFLGNIYKPYFNRFLLIRLIIVIFGTIVLFISNNMSILNELVLIYFSNLVINTVQAFFSKNSIFAIGLLLFVCCDVCVGLHNINAAYSVATFLMWVFYLPSQVLIVLA